MVVAQNGDRHSNGHVLVENQQTRLEPDSDMHEATSKSKVYRRHFLFLLYFTRRVNLRKTSLMNYGSTCEMSRVELISERKHSFIYI